MATGDSSTFGPTPTLPVTFLITDIVSSTRLWEAHGERMAAALELHDALIRSAVIDHGGSIFKTTGDGMMASFAEPTSAIMCAATAQRSLRNASWGRIGALLVRMAVHAGVAQSRDGDFYGPALNRIARLVAIGHGEQILVSGEAASAVERDRVPGLELIDLGHHRLRDLDRAQHVFQVTLPDLPRDFADLRSLAPDRTNLPAQLTSFVGRERELRDLRSLTAANRLVTLIGTGGTGKTRLMLQAGVDLVDRHEDGVWLVELAPITDPSRVVGEVARVLRVGPEPARATIDALQDFLRGKSILLLIDNCEHLIAAVAELIDDLLAACPTLAVIGSSREALGIGGESVFQVPSLALPPPTDPRAVEEDAGDADLLQSEAVQLFVDRATASSPSFALTATNVRAVVEICTRLDGIPLAIELAAARVTVLTVEEIARRLGDRFRLLTGGRRTALPRQQTLQALVDWSWDLLTESDQRLLGQLSVLAGWTLEAATAITADLPAGQAASDAAARSLATIDGLARLVDRSLVIVDRGEPSRYRMLETIRQYARDRLIATGEADALRDGHLAYFLDVGLQAERALPGPDMIAWLNRIEQDVDNVRSAIEWGFESAPTDALRLAVALTWYWRSRTYGPEALDWLQRAAAVGRSLPITHDVAGHQRAITVARVLAAQAIANAVWANALPVRAMAEEAVQRAREVADPQALIEALMALATVLGTLGETGPAIELSMEAIQVAEGRSDWAQVAMAVSGVAFGQALSGDLEGAESNINRARVAAERSGNPFVIAFSALSRGRFSAASHRLADARAAFATAISLYRGLDDRRFELVVRSDLAHAVRSAGLAGEAAEMYRATIKDWLHLGSRGPIANQLECLAFIALDQDPDRAARLLGAAEQIREDGAAPMTFFERTEYVAAVERVSGDAYAAAWEDGRRLTIDAAVALASSAGGDDSVDGGSAQA